MFKAEIKSRTAHVHNFREVTKSDRTLGFGEYFALDDGYSWMHIRQNGHMVQHRQDLYCVDHVRGGFRMQNSMEELKSLEVLEIAKPRVIFVEGRDVDGEADIEHIIDYCVDGWHLSVA